MARIFKNQIKTLEEKFLELSLGEFIISKDNKDYQVLFQDSSPLKNIRSLSKCVLTICLGIAIDQKTKLGGQFLTLDTFVWPFFEDKIKLENLDNLNYLKKITIRHLLTHTIGFDEGLLFKKDLKNFDENNLLNYLFNFNITHKPGKHFVYSNAGAYIFSALIQNELGISLDDWANGLLFKKLGIKNYNWQKYGNYCAGATGLELGLKDLHKITKLLLNFGKYQNQQIVSKKWIDLMISSQILISNPNNKNDIFKKYAYGLSLTLCANGIFYSHGAGGQYIIISPKKDLAITILNDNKELEDSSEIIQTSFKEMTI